VAPPPLIHLGFVLLGLAVHPYWPAPILPGAGVRWAGLVVVLLSVALAGLSIREFRRFNTSFQPQRPATCLIRTGPFRYSRNPLYIFLIGMHIGIGLLANSFWVLGMLAPALVIMSAGVIAREERYLEGKFGKAYLDYKASVRRWL
jgi:protein-S-isoprenylcysteine O-methyltransferase Ste14